MAISNYDFMVVITAFLTINWVKWAGQ